MCRLNMVPYTKLQQTAYLIPQAKYPHQVSQDNTRLDYNAFSQEFYEGYKQDICIFICS